MITILLLNSAMVDNTTTAEYKIPQNLLKNGENHKMSLDSVALFILQGLESGIAWSQDYFSAGIFLWAVHTVYSGIQGTTDHAP